MLKGNHRCFPTIFVIKKYVSSIFCFSSLKILIIQCLNKTLTIHLFSYIAVLPSMEKLQFWKKSFLCITHHRGYLPISQKRCLTAALALSSQSSQTSVWHGKFGESRLGKMHGSKLEFGLFRSSVPQQFFSAYKDLKCFYLFQTSISANKFQ